jgi:hypothetical protein
MPETPLEKLKKMTAADMVPVLPDAAVAQLLEDHAVPDAAGNPPGGVDWTPTYDLNSAAASGWLLKAAKASCLVEVDPPGSGIMTSKIFENCCAMAKSFRAKTGSSVLVPRPSA